MGPAQSTFDMEVRQAAREVADLVIRKQRAYGPKNILNCPVGVEAGIAVRLSDKIARLINLSKKGESPEWETLIDTADDIIGYGLVLKMYLSGKFELPLELPLENIEKVKPLIGNTTNELAYKLPPSMAFNDLVADLEVDPHGDQ